MHLAASRLHSFSFLMPCLNIIIPAFVFDDISMNLIKNTKMLLIEPLTIIINQMITNVIVPDKLKISKVIPIYKKDNEKLFTNYRPISLLPSISKIFEKVIFNQTYKYFQNHFFFSMDSMVLELNTHQKMLLHLNQ